MRKRFLVLLTVTLTAALLGPMATAAVKPGTTCKKAGQTSTSSGIKYTCVKSGKKLVWNKGVTVKVAVKPELNPVISNANPRIKNKVGTEYFFRSRPMFSIVKILII